MMETKILIIENAPKDFWQIRKKLVGDFYAILPEKVDEMIDCIESGGNRIIDYVLKQIDENYKELKLILCDIRLNNNDSSGERVVQAIRNHRIPDFPIWTSLVPVIAITGHVVRQDPIIKAGADFSLNKEKINKDEKYFLTLVEHNITSFERRLEFMYPNELKEKIRAFKSYHQDEKTAFIMTSFAEEHTATIKLIIDVLETYNITPCIANKQGGEHDDNLWPNIEVFIHGCDFGVGIYADDSILKGNFEIEKNVFEQEECNKEYFKRIRINPNMSQEVGYMLGLQKKVCILKDKKLDKLPTDLAGRIYVEYENEEDLKQRLGEWITNKVLSEKNK